MKKFTKKTAAAVLSLAMSAGLFAMNASAATFSDMSPDHWAYDTVNLMVQKGVITGYDDGTFRPDDPITLQEVAALALRAVNWPVGRGGAENYVLKSSSESSAENNALTFLYESLAERKSKIQASINACDEWARTYIKALIGDIDPCGYSGQSSVLMPYFDHYDEENVLMSDAFERPTEPVQRWIAFDILARAAYYNGSAFGNNVAYDAWYNFSTEPDLDEKGWENIWGSDIEVTVWDDAPYAKTRTYPVGQKACYEASKHGLVALEKTADVKHPGQTIASANPFGTLTRAEAATLIARLKHPERRIYNMEMNPENSTFYLNILNNMGIQPTVVYDTPMAESDYTIAQKGMTPEAYEEIFQAWQHAENWIQLLIEKSTQ